MPFVAPTLLTSEQATSAVLRLQGGTSNDTTGDPIARCDGIEILSNNGLIDQISSDAGVYYAEVNSSYTSGSNIRATIKSPYSSSSFSSGEFDIWLVYYRDYQNPDLYTLLPAHYGPVLVSDDIPQPAGTTATITTTGGTREAFGIRIIKSSIPYATGSWGDTVDIMLEVIS